ncbi:MAG: hypothetical protein WCX74_02720 [Candidatus Paceibacterota bacterium]
MKTKILLITFFCFGFLLAETVSAQPNLDNLVYPISELGQCASREECENYCSQEKNMVSCIEYAEKKNLLSVEDLKVSKIVAQKIANGETPGGCKTKEECETFCKGKVENMDKCISFGESLGVIPREELAQAKNILKALNGGAKMPGGCITKESCESYCAIGSNIDECLDFAEKAEILPPDELKEARRVAQFVKDGSTPGKCKNKSECQQYCNDSSHWEECIVFAEKAQLITKEEAEMAKKAGGSGPGGCKSQKECEDYCNDSKNYNECVKFGMEKDILTEKEKDLIENGVENMNKALNGLPDDIKGEIIKCLESSIGKDKFEKIKSKQEPVTKEIGGKIEACFAGIENKMKTKAMQSMPSTGGAPANIPAGPPAGIPSGSMPNGAPQAPNIGCENFSAVPSCDLVPTGIARDACNKCK